MRKNTITLAFASLLLLGSLFAFSELFSAVRAASSHTTELGTSLSLDAKREQQVRSMKTVLADTAPERKELETYLVARDGVVGFLERIETLGRIAEVNLEVASVGVEDPAPSPGGGVELVRVMLEARGAWGNLMRLLDLLESMPLSISFTRASISTSPDERSAPWKLSLTLFAAKTTYP